MAVGQQLGQWHVSLFGGLRVAREGHTEVRLRSKKAGGVLAYLAFFRGQASSREVLIDLFWPDCDIETGRQNLRAALAILRREFETADYSGSFLMADRDAAWLNPEVLTTDVALFREAITGAETEPDDDTRARRLLEGLSLYRGPILPGHDASWIVPQQLSLEEEYSQAAVKACDLLCDLGDPDQSVKLAKNALTLYPLREDVHIAAMRAQAMAGRPSEAIRQFEELERMLDDQWGESPSAEAVRALENLPEPIERSRRPTAVLTRTDTVAAATKPAVDIGGRLPSRMTAFIGRAEEIGEIAVRLDPSQPKSTRLLTIAGPGGCGKTRLSTEVAKSLLEQFEKRVWHIPLAETVDPSLVVNVIRSSLGIVPSPRSDPMVQVAAFLAGRNSLLVLDNFEQLVDEGSATVAELLENCPGLTCLVTSRRPLRLEGEHVFSIKPLPVPKAQDSLVGIGACESVQLFTDRARAVRPDFKLNRNNAEAVAELCRRLDGLPLALELAASRASVASPAQILARLGGQSDFLSSRLRNTPERHRSLKATMDWSVKLLKSEEAEMFRSCGVFRGGWTVEAAAHLCPACDAELVLDTLVENSLVQANPVDDVTRYSMLEPVRENALSLLQDQGSETAARKRHLEFFADLAESQGKLLNGPAQAGAAHLIEAEMDNLQEAVVWATKQKSCPEAALRLVGGIRAFFGYRGHSDLWYRNVRALLELPYKGIAEPRIQALLCSGALGYYRSEFEAARSTYDEARALAEKHGLDASLGDAISGQGLCCRANGDFDDATAFYEEALNVSMKCGALGTAGRVKYNLGLLREFLDQFEEAKAQFTASLGCAERIEDIRLIARNHDALGRCALHDGDPEKAIVQHWEAARLLSGVDDKIGEMEVLGNIAVLELARNRPDEAVRMFKETLLPSWELQNYWELRSNLVYMATGFTQLEQFESAVRALAVIRAIDSRYPIEMRKADVEACESATKEAAGHVSEDKIRQISAEVNRTPLGDVIAELARQL